MKRLLLWIPLTILVIILFSGCPGLFGTLEGDTGDPNGDSGDADPEVDLSVGVVDFSLDVATGQVTGVEFVVSNNGDAPALNADYRVVVSSNQIVGTNSSDDITVFEDTITVDAGGQETVALTTEIQDYITTNSVSVNPADYYVGVILDPGGNIGESNEQNNTGVSSSTGFIGGAGGGGGGGGDDTSDVDLTVNSVAFNLDQQQSVESLTVTFGNTGSSAVSDVVYRLFLSEDNAPGSDIRVFEGFVDIPAGGTQSVTVTLTEIGDYIQANDIVLTAGTYWGVAGIDPGNNVAETNEDNNYDAVTPTSEYLSGPGGGGDGGTGDGTVDLSVNTVTFGTDQQSNITDVQIALENGGTGDAADVGFQLWFSTDTLPESADPVVYESTVSLAAGTQTQLTVTTDDISTYMAGQGMSLFDDYYYALVFIDHENAIAETNEDNNFGTSLESASWVTPLTEPTISGLTSLQDVTGGSSAGEAAALDFGVQYQDRTFYGSDDLYYAYTVVPGAPYEVVVDDSFVDGSPYDGNIMVTLSYLDQTAGTYLRNFGSVTYDFNSPNPDDSFPETGDFIAPPSTEQVLLVQPFNETFDNAGTFGFGVIEAGGAGLADQGYGSAAETVNSEAPVLTTEEATYQINSENSTVHTFGLDVADPISETIGDYRYVRVWLVDAGADVEASFRYMTVFSQVWNDVTAIAVGDQTVASVELASDSPAVFALPDDITALQMVVTTPLGGSVPVGQGLYSFAYDLYGYDPSGEEMF